MRRKGREIITVLHLYAIKSNSIHKYIKSLVNKGAEHKTIFMITVAVFEGKGL